MGNQSWLFKNKISILISTILSFILVFSLVVYYFENWMTSPLERTSSAQIYIEEGSNFSQITSELKNQKIIEYPFVFKFFARIKGKAELIKPGTYSINPEDSPETLLEKFVNGESIKIKITIPEGLNIYQISKKLSEYFPKSPEAIWLKTMSDPEIIATLPEKVQTKNVEGFLFPTTYFFDPNSKPKYVVSEMIKEFKNNVSEQLFQDAKRLGLNLLQFVTLASIVEKESSLVTEHSLIAAVFLNRLKINMRLQSDPTVIYGKWDKYEGNITKNDLQTFTQYNTYTINGLPPGPIANPGLQTLIATSKPSNSKALYFVAQGIDKGHTFSNSYKEHQKAVQNYLKNLRKSQN